MGQKENSTLNQACTEVLYMVVVGLVYKVPGMNMVVYHTVVVRMHVVHQAGFHLSHSQAHLMQLKIL